MKKLLMILIILIPLHGFPQGELIEINISQDYPENDIIIKGMPFVLHMAIQSAVGFTLQEVEAGFDDSIPMSPEDRAWLDSVYAPVIIADTPALWYSSLILDILADGQKKGYMSEAVLLNPLPAAISMFYPGQPLHIYFGFDPRVTSHWKAGEIECKAGIIRNFDTLWSLPLKVKIPNTSAIKMKDMNLQELVYVGEYFLRSDRCDKAYPYADAIIDSGEKTFESTLFLAATDECRGDTLNALRRYNEAYNLYYSQQVGHVEPPFHLMKKIKDLQQQFLVPDEEP